MTNHDAQGLWMPLTLAQLDFWEEFRFHPGESVSTVAHALELRGVTDMAALTRAIEATIAETDIMALRFALDPDGQPVQRVEPGRQPVLRQIDLSGDPDGRARAFAMMQADVDAPWTCCRSRFRRNGWCGWPRGIASGSTAAITSRWTAMPWA
ncbi:MAG: hypothetical protein Q4615_08125 [Paracoccus aminovorans]|nr:hypothetical protein [Paracoccus aminovorans]